MEYKSTSLQGQFEVRIDKNLGRNWGRFLVQTSWKCSLKMGGARGVFVVFRFFSGGVPGVRRGVGDCGGNRKNEISIDFIIISRKVISIPAPSTLECHPACALEVFNLSLIISEIRR